MAEVRKFSQESEDDLQRLVRQQIGDTVLPTPPGHGAPEGDEGDAAGQTQPAPDVAGVADVSPATSFLFYPEAVTRPPQTPSPEAGHER